MNGSIPPTPSSDLSDYCWLRDRAADAGLPVDEARQLAAEAAVLAPQIHAALARLVVQLHVQNAVAHETRHEELAEVAI